MGERGKKTGEREEEQLPQNKTVNVISTSDIGYDGTLLAWTHIKNNFVTQTGPYKKLRLVECECEYVHVRVHVCGY